MKRIWILSVFSLFLACKGGGPGLTLSPPNPVVGQALDIEYWAKGGGYLVLQFTLPDMDSLLLIKVEEKGKVKVKIPDEAENVRVKLISKEEEVERGALPLFYADGRPVQETYYNLAQENLSGGLWGTPDKESTLFFIREELKNYPDFKRGKALLLSLQIEGDKATKALLDTLSDREVAFWVAYEKDDSEKALEIGPQVLDEMAPKDRKYALLNLALYALLKGKMDQSWAYFERLIQEFPDYRRGRLYYALYFNVPDEGDRERLLEAKERWEAYLQRVPDDYKNLYTNYAKVVKALGDSAQVESLTRSALKGMTDEWFLKKNAFYPREIREKRKRAELANIYGYLGNILKERGDYEGAEDEIKMALHYAPDESKAFLFPELVELYREIADSTKLLETYRDYYPYATDPEGLLRQAQDLYRALKGTREGFDQFFRKEKPRKKAPDFEVTSLDEKRVRLSELKGKVVVINFWATWCGPCKREIPELNRLADTFRGNERVFFMGISHEDKKTLEDFLKDHQFKYRIFYGGKETFQKYAVMGIPTHVIVDQEGRIFKKFIGFTPDIQKKLGKNILELLGKTKEKVPS